MIAVLVAALALPDAALAQHQPVVVPAEASVVIPARGAAQLGQAPAVRRVRRSYSLPAAPPEPAVSPLLVALPLGAAAALVAATLAGGSSGGGGISAPSRTR